MITDMDGEEDEIAILAREKMIIGVGCEAAIDHNIAEAEHEGRWSDMNKWHRVRLRVQRMRQQLDTAYALERSQGRRNAARIGSI